MLGIPSSVARTNKYQYVVNTVVVYVNVILCSNPYFLKIMIIVV